MDFVVNAITISHRRIEEVPNHWWTRWATAVGDVLDIFSKAVPAPKMNLFVNAALGFIPKTSKVSMAIAPVRRIRRVMPCSRTWPA